MDEQVRNSCDNLTSSHQCLSEQTTPLTFLMIALLPDGRVLYVRSIFFPSPDAVPSFTLASFYPLSKVDFIVSDAFRVLVRDRFAFGAQERTASPMISKSAGFSIHEVYQTPC
jgi:hypothetical protein